MIKSFDAAIRDGALYEIGTYTFRDSSSQARLFAFDLTGRHAGRIDLVSFDVFGTTEEVELICDLNGIVNPHKVSTGDVLIVCLPDDAPLFQNRRDETEALREALVNPTKATKRDKARAKYLAGESERLAATFVLPSGQQAVREEDGRIRIYPV